MRWPASLNSKPPPSLASVQTPPQLRDYFQKALQTARDAEPGATVPWPTVKGFAAQVGVNHNTVRGWIRRRLPGFDESQRLLGEVRLELAELGRSKKLVYVFDTEWVGPCR